MPTSSIVMWELVGTKTINRSIMNILKFGFYLLSISNLVVSCNKDKEEPL